MKLLKKLAAAAAVSFALTGVAQADEVLNDWVLNPTGTGGAAAGQVINEYLDINGNAFIQITPTSGTTFSFAEHGVFNSQQADSNGQQFDNNFGGKFLTATFDAFGTGTFGGGFSFTGGTISIYSSTTYGGTDGTSGAIYGANTGTLIATFDVMVGGGGVVDASGSPINNGQVSILAKATSPDGLKAGYFFGADGTDLSTSDLLSFAFTNANTVRSPTAALVTEVACQYAGFTGNGCTTGTTYANSSSAFFVSNNGQFKLAEVPEPGSLALFGIAMLGAGVVSRKRAAKKAA